MSSQSMPVSHGCGLQDAYITQALRPNVRVTLQMGPQPTEMTLQQPGLGSGQQVLFGQLAKPSSPRETQGTYWGYTTRLATSLSQVFQDSSFEVGHRPTHHTCKSPHACYCSTPRMQHCSSIRVPLGHSPHASAAVCDPCLQAVPKHSSSFIGR